MAFRVGNVTSSWEKVTSGVPQGSVLGPLLFSLFINDLPDSVQASVKLFADDVKHIGNAAMPDDIQGDLNKLSDWERKWYMTFNVSKCFVMHMGEANANHGYFLNGNIFESVLHESDLGVTMSHNCEWKEQIEKAIGKANRTIAWLVHNTVSRLGSVMLSIYTSIIRSHLEYYVQVWSPTLRRGNWAYIMSLEGCQRRFTKCIAGLEALSYKKRLLRLGLTTLLERRARGDLKETFKITKGFVDYGRTMFRNSRSGRNLLHKFIIW